MSKTKTKYPEGHFIAIGIAIGIPLGLPLGLAMGNIALGPGLGLPIGVAIGLAMEEKYKREGRIRPLTKEEKKRQKLGAAIGIGLLGILMLIGIMFFFLRAR